MPPQRADAHPDEVGQDRRQDEPVARRSEGLPDGAQLGLAKKPDQEEEADGESDPETAPAYHGGDGPESAVALAGKRRRRGEGPTPAAQALLERPPEAEQQDAPVQLGNTGLALVKNDRHLDDAGVQAAQTPEDFRHDLRARRRQSLRMNALQDLA